MPDAVAPDGSDIYFRVQDAERASLVEVALAVGQTSRPVRHRTVEEVWYFLSGSGEVWLQSPDGTTEETRSVAPGDTVVDQSRLRLSVSGSRRGTAALPLLHLAAVAWR